MSLHNKEFLLTGVSMAIVKLLYVFYNHYTFHNIINIKPPLLTQESFPKSLEEKMFTMM